MSKYNVTVNQQEHKIINKKWVLQILIILSTNKELSYRKIKNTLSIPNSTLALRLNELTRYKYLQKFVYGSKSKPHYTEYAITDFGLEYINNIITIH